MRFSLSFSTSCRKLILAPLISNGDRVVPETWVFRVFVDKLGKRQVEQGFSSFFCQIFGIVFDDFQNFAVPLTCAPH